MNLGFWLCMVCVPFYLVLALIFGILKEKSAIFISGFNTLPKKEQCLYDHSAMAKDMHNRLLLWTAIMTAGSIGSYFISGYVAIAAYAIWFISLICTIRLDAHKAFEKYFIN